MALDRWRLENAQAKAGGRQAGQWWTGGGPVATLRPAEASSSGAIKLLTNPGVPVCFEKKVPARATGLHGSF